MDKEKEKESGVRMYSIRLMIATSLEEEELAEAVEIWADKRFQAHQEPSIVAVDELLATGSLLKEGVYVALRAARDSLKCTNELVDKVERLATVTEKLAEGKVTREET